MFGQNNNRPRVVTLALFVIAMPVITWLTFRPAGASQQSATRSYQFINGRWFDGKGFADKTFFTVNGFLTSIRPARIDSVVDLAGKYVVPPFGEAHNHNVAISSQIDGTLRQYLIDGIFYVKNPASLLRSTLPLRGRINTPTGIDAVFSNGLLTASGGHPMGLVRRNLQRGVMTASDGEGAFYFTIDTRDDLDAKWEAIEAGNPDFIKTILCYSEEYDKRKDDTSFFSWRGLNPALVAEIVRRSRESNLPVSAHVETAADFHAALVAGVDEINHIPGFRPEGDDVANYKNLSRYEITESDAQLAARNQVVVVTTLGGIIEWALEGEQPKEVRDALLRLVSHNLHILQKHGAPIAIGSDSYRHTSLPEALSLHKLKIFDNRSLLKMWCETTASTIFPNRKIGYLKEGYEASFLVLNGDPIRDFKAVQDIDLRVKQGEILLVRD